MRTLMVCCIAPALLFCVGCRLGTIENPNSAPVISRQPQSQSVPVGRSKKFAVSATGYPALSYQWRKNGAYIAKTSDSFTIASVQLADAGTYSVVVSNGEGSITSDDAVLTVWTPAAAVMRYVPGGTFLMGQPDPDLGSTHFSYGEQPAHSVTVSAFYMDTTEVTQMDYLALRGANPSHFAGDLMRPVETVSWFDAALYCNERSRKDGKDTVYTYTSITEAPGNGCIDLGGIAVDYTKNGYRLPTEAEWEYACRAGDTAAYYWGKSYPPQTTADTAAMDSNAVWQGTSNDSTATAGSKPPNAWGLYDMAGNVYEWCNDWYYDGYYSSSPSIDPTGPFSPSHPALRVARGGAWNDGGASGFSALRSSYRGRAAPESGSNACGFRCVRREQ